ncbi:MAG TPA: response regulator [Phenylobacterium sp.]
MLLADDNHAICELVVLMLEDIVDVTAVHDGEAAVRLAAERPFDVILLDQRMPRLDGPGALRTIRSRPGPNRDIPALAFSAEGDHASVSRATEQGFCGLVLKPFSGPELVSAIAAAVTTSTIPELEGARE